MNPAPRTGVNAPHGKTHTTALRTHGEVGRPWGGKEPARCARTGCGHLLTMHDEGGCALAECSCHEGVNPVAFRSPVSLSGGCRSEGCACGEVDGWAVARIVTALRKRAAASWNADRADLAVAYEDAASQVEGLASSEGVAP